MDRPSNHKRAYPGYTLAELKAWLKDPKTDEQTKRKAQAEIEARESGKSVHRPTPQVSWDADETGNKYNAVAVNREIAKDPRIKGKEAKLIHSLLQGRSAPVRVTKDSAGQIHVFLPGRKAGTKDGSPSDAAGQALNAKEMRAAAIRGGDQNKASKLAKAERLFNEALGAYQSGQSAKGDRLYSQATAQLNTAR